MFSFFQNNKKRTTPSKQPSPPSPTTVTSTTLNPSTKSSFTSSVSNEQPLTPLSQAPPPPPPAHHTSVAESDIHIPQVEFEQSRSLLQLDFFGPDQQQLSTDFPQFDHLLNKPSTSETETPETKEHYNKFGTLNRKLTKTLRHRLSLRPNQSNKRVKRSISTPNLA
ncbi:uncharacterized protein ATC70_001286 [Mucor velutinosus]|uniref:Uncharacterized protein n=1 Tax=Mucor velutinosus TaxID=708070 RepID=A0AAN7DI64_9FUNG|nr:hypothetical protein ATC70_001286 [Mucor velutinosus]